MRETTKTVKIGPEGEEKTYKLNKMNALAGTYLVKFCAEKLLPVYNSLQETFTSSTIDVENLEGEALVSAEQAVAKERTEKIINMIPQALEKLSDSEVENLIVRCLRTVEVLKPAGWQPAMTSAGRFGDEELEYDTVAVLRLVYEVLVFNLGSFFGGGALGSLLSNKTSSPQNA